ncbi:MAG: diacylglycerol/polyprenol kinase family protein [Phycisphaeraceae bacterium]
MISPWLAMPAVLVTFAAMVAGLAAVQRQIAPHPEVVRKLLHVGMGLVVLSFPWLFDAVWPVATLAGLAAGGLLAVRVLPLLRDRLGRVVSDVQRPSLGEIYYPLAVALVWGFSFSRGDELLYLIPMLILTLADAVAALIGLRYGTLRYQTLDGFKSAEGSVAFFTVAFLSSHVPLLLLSDVGRPESLLIGLILGLLVALIEAISWRGLDNLAIPLGAFVFLLLYRDEPPPVLGLRLAATLALVAFALAWRRRTTLDDSSLMAAGLFGYAAWMIAGWLWLIPPLVLFLVHTLAWPRTGPRYHNVYAVLSVTSAGLVWLFLYALTRNGQLLIPYAIAFAAHLAIIGVSRIAWQPEKGRPGWRVAGSSVAGWGLCFIPVLLMRERWLLMSAGAAGGGLVLIAATAFYLLIPRLYQPSARPAVIHVWGAVLGGLASLPAAMAFA